MTNLRLTQDGSATLRSERYNQTFASERGALSEARHVYLTGSGVAQRLSQQVSGQVSGEQTVRVLEVGFGTGLNFFVTAAACLTPKPANPAARLCYTALEQTLLDAATVRQLRYGKLLESEFVEQYLVWRDTTASDNSIFETEQVRLTLLLGEATAQTLPAETFHTVYHDAFSPEVNPELWTENFLATLVATLQPGGTLVSYCVQGAVRRRLQALGLTVEKRPGPAGGKREVLFAQRPVDTRT